MRITSQEAAWAELPMHVLPDIVVSWARENVVSVPGEQSGFLS